MKKRKEFFDDIAHRWDEEHNTPEEQQRTKKFAIRHFRLNKGETVLDIGCGTSRLAPYLTRQVGNGGRVIELDISLEMLKIGKQRYNNRNLVFVQGDGHQLPLKDHSFDRVICMAFFPHLKNKQQGIRAMGRILKPGGYLIIAHQMNREELNRFHGNIDGAVSNDLLPDKDDMRELFENSGFIDIDIREEPGLYLAVGKSK